MHVGQISAVIIYNLSYKIQSDSTFDLISLWPGRFHLLLLCLQLLPISTTASASTSTSTSTSSA